MMIRKHTALGLALIAALSIGAALPSHARTEVTFTVAQSATIKGEQSEPNVFTAAGIETECDEAVVHGSLGGNSRTLVVEPTYGECNVKALTGLPAKYVLSGCTYLLHATERLDEERWGANVDIACLSEYSMEWHSYESQDAYDSGLALCNTAIPPQTGLGTAELTNIRGDSTGVAIHWNLRGIEYRVFGSKLFCGSPFEATRDDAALEGTMTLIAENAGEQPIDFAVSGTPSGG